MTIGYRLPHRSQQQIEKLREAYEEHREEMFLAEMNRRLDVERKTVIPIKLNYAIPAIRMWLVSSSDLLKSVGMHFEYDDAIMREIAAPEFRGTTGFWAVKPRGAGILEREYVNKRERQVFGMVELSGKVVEHEHGWRAEVCTIQELYIVSPRPEPELITRFEELYQCDVYQVADFRTFLRVAFE